LRLTNANYIERSLSVVVPSGGTVDLQDVELSPASGTATVFGHITDAGTGQSIREAVVSIMGTVISARTDSNGKYRLEGLEPGNKTLTFNATGYDGQTVIFGLTQPGEYEIDRALISAENNGLGFTFISTDRTSYSAHTAGEIHANVSNNGSPVEAVVTFALFNDFGELVSEFIATRPGEKNTMILFAPGVIESVVAPFNTANLPPGEYRIIGRVKVGNQMIGPATAILAERATSFTIDETAVISQLRVDPIPKFFAVGVTGTVNLQATIVNRSNVPVQLRFTCGLFSPKGVRIRTSPEISILVQPEQDNLSKVFDNFSQTFSESGEHTLKLFFQSSTVPETIETDVLSIAPGLRIDSSQSVTPAVVTPDEDQRVRIKIHLEGREVQ
jgi:Carboxypeptidase regulatory-like domain